MCNKCVEGLEHLRSPGKIKISKEAKAKLPGKASNKKTSEMTLEELEQHRLYRRHYERLYREARKNLKEYQAQYHLNYAKNHPEILKARTQENYEKYKDRYYAQERNRRAKEANVYSEKYFLKDVLNMWGTDCHLCGGPIDLNSPSHSSKGDNWQFGLHLDHVVPIAIGGPDILENVKPAHAICNLKRSKNNTDVDVLAEGLDPKVLTLINVEFKDSYKKRGRRLKD